MKTAEEWFKFFDDPEKRKSYLKMPEQEFWKMLTQHIQLDAYAQGMTDAAGIINKQQCHEAGLPFDGSHMCRGAKAILSARDQKGKTE